MFDAFDRGSLLRMLPPEREVDCACASPLQRPVAFDPTGRNTRVTACVRCGVVTVTDGVIEEPRPHDVRCVGNIVLSLEPALLAWLAAWPRLLRCAEPEMYFAASLRAQDDAALQALERTELEAQRGFSRRMRWLRAGVPEQPWVGPIRPQLSCYRELWEGLRLDDETPFEELLRHVRTWGQPFAIELLLRRPALANDVVALLRSSERDRRGVGATLAAKLRMSHPEILDAIVRWIDASAIDAPDIHGALDLLVCLDSAARPVAPALLRLAERIGKSDYYLRKRVVEVAARVDPASAKVT